MKILYPFWYCTLGLYIKKTFFSFPPIPWWNPFSLPSSPYISFPSPTLKDSASPSKRTSVSSFQSTVDSDSAASISLNMELDNVNFHIKKPSKYPHVPPHPADQKGRRESPGGTQAQAGELGHRISSQPVLLASSVPSIWLRGFGVGFVPPPFSSPHFSPHLFWLVLFISSFLPQYHHTQSKACSLSKELHLTALPLA